MYKERLKEYIGLDLIYRDYKKGVLTELSDFDKFCIEHCQDIKDLLNEVEELHNKIEKAIEYIEDTLDLKEEYNDEVECVVIDILEILKGSGVDE